MQSISDYDFYRTGLVVILSLWLFSGLVLCVTISLSMIVSVGYVVFYHQSLGIVEFLSIGAFLVVWRYIFALLRGFFRHSIYGVSTIYRSLHFGAYSKSVWSLKWLFLESDGSIRPFIQRFIPNTVDEATIKHKASIWINFAILCCCTIPLLVVSFVWGFWAVVGIFCGVWTLFSVSAVILLDIYIRFSQYVQFLRSLWMNQEEDLSSELKSYYIQLHSPTKCKSSKDLWRSLLDRCIRYTFLAFCFSVFFNLNKPDTVVLLVTGLLALFFLGLKIFFFFRRRRRRGRVFPSTSQAPERLSAHSLFFVRSLSLLVSFACLVYLDLCQTAPTNGNTTVIPSASANTFSFLVASTTVFVVFVILRDVCFFISNNHFVQRFRPWAFLITQSLLLLYPIIVRVLFQGGPMTFTIAIFCSWNELRYTMNLVRKSLPNANSEAHTQAVVLTEDLHSSSHKTTPMQSVGVGSVVPTPAEQAWSSRLASNVFNSIWIIMLLMIIFGLLGGMVKSNSSSSPITTVTRLEVAVNGRSNAPLCSIRYAGLSVLDFGNLANISYSPTLNQVQLELAASGLQNLNVVFNNLDDKSGVRYFEFYNSVVNVSIVAVRGTQTAEDMLQDMYLWMTPSLLMTSSYLGTFFNAWPLELGAQLAYYIYQLSSYQNLVYFDEVEQHVQKIRPQRAEVFMTGHSLGGGIANIVGARLGLKSISFSSPGLGYISKVYSIQTEQIMGSVVNVIPRHDPVPKFDKQLGLLADIPCDATTGPISCHFIDNTLKTLSDIC